MLRRPQYAPPMPWGPPPTPPTRQRVLLRVGAVVAVLGLFAAVWFRAGWLALVLALALGWLLKGRPDKGRAVVELVAAGMLALLLTGAPTPKAPAVPAVKVPARVETAQNDQLADNAREWWAKFYARAVAQGGADPSKEAAK